MVNKIAKIVEKMKVSQSNWQFEDCQKVLEALGFTMKQGKGSHVKFFKQGHKMIVMAKHKPIAKAAVVEIIEIYNNYKGQ